MLAFFLFSLLQRILVGAVVILGLGLYLNYALCDVKSSFYSKLDLLLPLSYRILHPSIFDPECIHEIAMKIVEKGWVPLDLDRDEECLAVSIKGLKFQSPVGLAAGFDKNAVGPLHLMNMGFGFMEVGSITPEPQSGNPKPRIFRLSEDGAIINRCGFNSLGMESAYGRLEKFSRERWEKRLARRHVLGINIGKNKTSDAVEDIRKAIPCIGRFADFLVVNLSSPNTVGLRDLQHKDQLKIIIRAAREEIRKLEELSMTLHENAGIKTEGMPQTEEEFIARAHSFFPTQTGRAPLLFVKIAPDLATKQLEDIAEVALSEKLDGLVVSNTTIQRPTTLKDPQREEIGGLSGRPLREIATKCVSDIYKLTGGKIAIIASGGVFTGGDAFEKIKAGASLVEIYTGLIYRGPIAPRRIKDELLGWINQEGFAKINDAVGIDHQTFVKKKISPPKFN